MSMWSKFLAQYRRFTTWHDAYLNQPRGPVHCEICHDMGYDCSGQHCICRDDVVVSEVAVDSILASVPRHGDMVLLADVRAALLATGHPPRSKQDG